LVCICDLLCELIDLQLHSDCDLFWLVPEAGIVCKIRQRNQLQEIMRQRWSRQESVTK